MFTLVVFVLTLLSPPAEAARIKDIADIYGVRENSLSGVGLVTGLNRSGDSLRSEATIQSLANRLQGQGITLDVEQLRSRNVALVMVNASLPSSARPGQRVDVEVSSLGDATSLEGGVLQQTILFAQNGDPYASAEGPLLIGGFSIAQGGNINRKNYPTTGRVPNGATVQVDNPSRLAVNRLAEVNFLLKEPDFSTATRFAEAINADLGEEVASPMDESTIAVTVPADFQGKVVQLISQLEILDVEVDTPARIIINEKTGTVVMGSEITIAPVAITHGGLQIEVQRFNQVSQPGAFSRAQAVPFNNDIVRVEENDGQLTLVGGVTIGELVAALNQLGVKPRDMIIILDHIHGAGAIHGEIEVR
ncbi:MAG: flagellar basal body P-ring protein FlgI [Myxococcota bacterium]